MTASPYRRFPAEHWIRLRTTNPIESKGPGSRRPGRAMAFKLIESADAAGLSSVPKERPREQSR